MLNRTSLIAAGLACAMGAVSAQAAPTETERKAALIGPLMEQRNAAQNSLALCQADFGFLTQELEAARKEIEELRAKVNEQPQAPAK